MDHTYRGAPNIPDIFDEMWWIRQEEKKSQCMDWEPCKHTQ